VGRDDWYRNGHWDHDVEARFRARLSKSRSGRPQYLKIQAGYLAECYPDVALALIDDYFATGDQSHISAALGVRAKAFEVLGRVDEAVSALKQALAWEREHPSIITTARWDYPHLVAVKRLSDEYDEALNVLSTRFKPTDLAFPNSRYDWNGSRALILHERGHHADARHFAERALIAATETQSPFRYHRSLGIVKQTSDDFGRRIKAIARPSIVRSLFTLINVRTT
jgi:tetratricopeptide (TPR) repeat protein